MRVAYGPHDDQHLDIDAGEGTPQGTAVLLHGGYWRAALTSDLMLPMAADLRSRGWTTVNVEYRRVGSADAWPACRDDAITAIRAVRQKVGDGTLPGPTVLIGHSVGGQLALLAAHDVPSAVDGVLALAPVTDVVATLHDGLGEDAAAALLGDLDDPGQAARDASPVRQPPAGVPVVIVHGRDDVRVPIAHSLVFARVAGAGVDLRVRDSMEHRSAIDPSAPHWPEFLDALTAVRLRALAQHAA